MDGPLQGQASEERSRAESGVHGPSPSPRPGTGGGGQCLPTGWLVAWGEGLGTFTWAREADWPLSSSRRSQMKSIEN